MNSVISSIKEVCRICLQHKSEPVNIFDDEPESKCILDKIYLCFQIVLDSENYLPHTMCLDCLGELNAANTFRIKCTTFDDRFTSFLKNHENQSDFASPSDAANYLSSNVEVPSNYDSSSFKEDAEVDIEEKSSIEKKDSVDHIVDYYKCDMCSKVLKTKMSLSNHMISMHKKRKHIGRVSGFGPTRRYHCTSCSYSTPHSQTLVNHMRRHDGERPYHCECGKSFTQSSSLAAHRKTHSDITYYTCTICGKQFKHAYSLTKHLHVHESGKLVCKVCHKVLKSKQSLQDHMHRHYNIRNYNCEDCGDTFVTSSELISHRKKHSSDKRVGCYLCEFKTNTKKSLIIHLKRHTGAKHFKCDLCEVSFYTLGDVRRHRRVHTREKPFGCPTCTQKFTYSTSLNKHMMTVHGVHYKWGDAKVKETNKKTTLRVMS